MSSMVIMVRKDTPDIAPYFVEDFVTDGAITFVKDRACQTSSDKRTEIRKLVAEPPSGGPLVLMSGGS